MKPEVEKILIDGLVRTEGKERRKNKLPIIGVFVTDLRDPKSDDRDLWNTLFRDLQILYSHDSRDIGYPIEYEKTSENIVKDLLVLEKQGKITILNTKSFEFQWAVELAKEAKKRVYLEYMIKPYTINFENLTTSQKTDVAVNMF